MTNDPSAPLSDWVGRSRSRSQYANPEPMHGLAALLPPVDQPLGQGDPAPLLGHWLYFHDFPRSEALGEDGHERRGGFIPPVRLPRRMWAGSEIDFHRPLRIGASLSQHSTIAAVEPKHGRSGELVFVTVEHRVEDAEGPVLTEKQTLVYREAPAPGAPAAPTVPAPAAADWRQVVEPDPVLLFRYSALTWNSHRIHYDHPYATGVEGYPGLVVHGPLIATLMLHAFLAYRPGSRVTRFSFQGVKPIHDTAPFAVGGTINTLAKAEGTATLFASDASGALCTRASVAFTQD